MFQKTIDIASPGGNILWLGNISSNLELNKKTVSSILRKELTIKGSWNSSFTKSIKDDWSEALQGLHSSKYEFQSSIFTESLSKIQEAKEKVRCATLLINEHPAFRVDWMPFGGHKCSGLGMGGIQESMLASTKQKLIIEKHKTTL